MSTVPGTVRPDEYVATQPRWTWRWWLARVGRPLVAVLLIAAVGWAVVRQWDAVRGTIAAIELPFLLFSLLLAVCAMFCNVMAFNTVLDALGTRVPAVEASRCYLVGQLGKYLPGSVWAFVLQMELSKRAGVPRVNGFTATIVTLGISITTALLMGLIAISPLMQVGGATPWVVLILLPLAAICTLPPVLTRIIGLMLRLLRRRPLPCPLGWSHIGRALLWTTLAWTLFGTHLWLLISSEFASGPGGWVQSLGVFALAMTGGSLALVAPSGIGVREAIIIVALAPVVPTGVALGLALASRLVLVVADILAATVAAALGFRADRAAAAARS
ncbi:lysylphosphatidylglycerol synthase domain-containing protein [Pseudonocardia saturnea]